MVPHGKTAIAVIILGILVASLYLWSPQFWLLLAGTFIAGLGVSRLFELRRSSPREQAERDAIRALWLLARRFPRTGMLHDLVTGHLIGVERRFGMLTLFIADRPPPQDGSDDLDAVGTWYMLGSFGRPMPPPLMRRQGPLIEDEADSMSWRKAGDLLKFNDATGAMDATPDELAELLLKLQRVLANR